MGADPVTWDNTTQYQFLSGEWFLVAPVFTNTSFREGDVYLPEAEWIDYWNGDRFAGPHNLTNYSAPLDTLPVFVKGGAIIPMVCKLFLARSFFC